jgi:hypothetical protein
MKQALSTVLALILAGTMLPASAADNQVIAVKKYVLSPNDIRSLAPNRGGAIASDKITVEGKQVGYMYRSKPHNHQDSGWAFLAGDEDEAYMANGSNHGIYDVNTIANYDPAIIPFLDAPVGSAFFRDGKSFAPDPLGAPSPQE